MQVESIKLFPRLMKILIPIHPMLKFEHTIIEDTKSKIYPHTLNPSSAQRAPYPSRTLITKTTPCGRTLCIFIQQQCAIVC